MIAMLRELQAPLLALILLGACGFKLTRVVRARSVTAAIDAAALFTQRLRRPAAVATCVTEMSLGLALLATAGPAASGGAADAARSAAALFFLVGMCALVELRAQRPDLGCGCFGDLSSAPPGARSVIRAALLAGMALAGIRVPAFSPPPPGSRAAAALAILVAELLLLALLSPELGEALARLGYAEPCEVQRQSPRRPLTALHRSRSWRGHVHMITGGPADIWRELCWWYLAYPAREGDQDCQVVFAVEVKPRRPAVRAAVVRADAGAPPGPAANRLPPPSPDPRPAQADAPSAIF